MYIILLIVLLPLIIYIIINYREYKKLERKQNELVKNIIIYAFLYSEDNHVKGIEEK